MPIDSISSKKSSLTGVSIVLLAEATPSRGRDTPCLQTASHSDTLNRTRWAPLATISKAMRHIREAVLPTRQQFDNRHQGLTLT